MTGAPLAGRAVAASPSSPSVSPVPASIPSALPEYGPWIAEVWDAYLIDLVGWEYARGWAHLPATFRWHEFWERLAPAIEARMGRDGEAGSIEDESAIPKGGAL